MCQLNTCFGCGVVLTKDNDSAAHIIPSALGGKLKPKGLICRQCNGDFDRLADNPLIEAFGAWPTLLNTPRDRGEHPAKQLVTKAGDKVRVKADGSITPVAPLYKSAPAPGGTSLEIGAPNETVLQQLLQKAHKEYPQFDPVEAAKHARIAQMPNSPINAPINFGPEVTFGGAALCLWLFIVLREHHSVMGKEQLITTINNFKKGSGKLRYLVDGLPGLEGPAIDVGHKIVVRTIPATGELIGYVELLGALRIGGIYAKSQNPRPTDAPIEHIYVYDLLENRERTAEFRIDEKVFYSQSWEQLGFGLTDAEVPDLKAAIEKSMGPLVRLYEAGGNAQKPSSP